MTRKRWMWLSSGVIGLVVVTVAGAALWLDGGSLPAMQKVTNDHVKYMRFTEEDDLVYATRDNDIKRLDVTTGHIETVAGVDGFNVRLDPSGTFAGHVKNGQIHITRIEPNRVIRKLNGSIYTWQDDSTLMYVNNQPGDGIFIEPGRLTRYHFETDSRDRLTHIGATAIHPFTSYSGIVHTASGEEVSENSRLTLYSDRQDPKVVISDRSIDSTVSGDGLMLFQTENEPAVKIIDRQGRVQPTQLEPLGNAYQPITDDTIVAELNVDDRRVIGFYDVTEAVIESVFPLEDVGEVIDITASADYIAVATTDGLYIRELQYAQNF